MSKEAHPCAVLRGHQADVQALTFDHSETHLISGDAHGEVRVWALADLRPRSIRRLHPASAGIINLKLWRTSTLTASKSATREGTSKECSMVLVTQGRDGTTHMWEMDNELNILEGPPIRSFFRESFSFCRFSLLAAETDLDLDLDSNFLSLKVDQTPGEAALETKENAEAFVEAILAGVDLNNDAIHGAAKSASDVEMKENEKISASIHLQNSISAIHTCSSSTSCSSSKTEKKSQQNSTSAALIAIPSHSEKVVEVCCAVCGTPLALFLQKESEAAAEEAVTELDKWGMCMATKLFLGPKERNYDILLAVGYESGHVVLWSVTEAAKAYATTAATAEAASNASSGPSSVPYTPPKPLAYAKLHSEPIMALDIDSNGFSGVSGSAEDSLIAFSINYTPESTEAATPATATISPTATINLKKEGVADVSVRSDGKLIASAGWDGKIRVYKKSTGKALAVFKYHSAAASAVAFSPKTFLMASGARDGTVALWDIYSRQKK